MARTIKPQNNYLTSETEERCGQQSHKTIIQIQKSNKAADNEAEK